MSIRHSPVQVVPVLGLAFLLGACDSETDPASAIESAFKQARQLNRAADQAVANGADWLEVKKAWLDRVYRIDTRNAPADFRMAWVRHLGAWRDLIFFVDSLPKDAETAFVLGFLRGLSGQPDGGVAEICYEESRLTNAVNATYAELEVLAAKYGAAVPPAGNN